MKKPSSPAAASVSIESLEQRGREQLRQARFKDAVETFKKLVKQDKQPLWKELLNQAYVGYARHLAVKGMAKEAQITLDNTASAGGLVQDPALYFSCLVLQNQYQKAAAFYRRISTSVRPVRHWMRPRGHPREHPWRKPLTDSDAHATIQQRRCHAGDRTTWIA
jgi:tetratricopeptide (TPR) repeat protein